MAGYSGTPLVTKLGIKDGHRVVVLGAPAGFALDLPDGAAIRKRLVGPADVVLFFATLRASLQERIEGLGRAVQPAGAVWVAWPKKAAKVATNMTEDVVRDVALPLGLVDTKVCAIDDTWSGLKLVWRKSARQPSR
ncbi:MAG TPA: DUF3052 domain-containing protein [Acidimicrobiales bacterium]|nr:DUF3052 domain-containing protein [Acidimicrobiales bacterium]